VVGEVRLMVQVPTFLPAVTFSILVVTFLPLTFVTTFDILAVQGPVTVKAETAFVLVIKARLVVPLNFKALGALKPTML